ncbi:MAG: hypothetical protein HWD62_18020 [Cyclobacteriaceae bacterium]|nr:MAG: hypothetical protein HWD62_18020 [Cyclobacteriaceae bacterium]
MIYGGSIVVALVLVAWKLNANKEYNETRTAIVRESSSGAVPVLVKRPPFHHSIKHFLKMETLRL